MSMSTDAYLVWGVNIEDASELYEIEKQAAEDLELINEDGGYNSYNLWKKLRPLLDCGITTHCCPGERMAILRPADLAGIMAWRGSGTQVGQLPLPTDAQREALRRACMRLNIEYKPAVWLVSYTEAF